MKANPVISRKDFRDFYNITREIYKDNGFYRSTEDDISRLLLEGPSDFRLHASVKPYLMLEGGSVAGRFALIHDLNSRMLHQSLLRPPARNFHTVKGSFLD